MADALVSPAVAGTMYVCSGAVSAYCVRRLRMEDDQKKIPLMGVMGAFVFAAQMINFTIPGTGSSGHICGGFLLSALLGPWAGFLTMVAILLIQCLMFADGGLLALGCNIWNMAFYGCFVGALLIWKPMVSSKTTPARITLASVLGCMITLQMGAFSVVVETTLSGITELPFGVFTATMLPVHLAIGLVEGLITAAVLCFVAQNRPELLWKAETAADNRMSRKKVLGILACAAALTGGLLSLFASSFPDGLEWTLEKVAGTAELPAEGGIYSAAGKIQETLSLLPDYGFRSMDTAAGTTFSGLVGGIIVLAVCLALCYGLKLFMKARVSDR